MSYVDIAIIALLVLFAAFGILTGIKKSALSLGAFLVAFLIAFFLAKPVAEGFLNIEGVRTFVLGNSGWSLYTWLNSFSSTFDSTSEYLQTNFYKPVIDIISNYPGYTESFTIAEGQALYYAFLIFSAIIGVGLYIVLRLLLCIATMIIKSFIGKRKKALSRLFGFLVGAVRGGLWALTFTLIFSMIGGFTFVPFIDTVQAEYERAVVANYVNDFAYTLRNNWYLPNADMFARIVDKSGIIVKEEDVDKDEFVLLGQELELYIDFVNLNYNQTVCTHVDGEAVFSEGYEAHEYKISDYSHTGFGDALKAIMDYNAAAADKIKEGALSNMSTSDLKTYLTIVQDSKNAISDITIDLITQLANYETEIVDDSALSDPELVTSANGKLSTMYDNIRSTFEGLKILYSGLQSLGTLDIGEYPSVVVVSAVEAEA